MTCFCGEFAWQSARYALSYDGLMNVLEMRKTRKYDSGTVQVVGKNPLGEVDCSTTLNVIPLEDLRSSLRHTSSCKWLAGWYVDDFCSLETFCCTEIRLPIETLLLWKVNCRLAQFENCIFVY